MTPYDSFQYDPRGDADSGWHREGGFTPMRHPAPVVRALLIANIVVFLVQLGVDRFTSFDTLRWFGLSAHYGVGRLCVWQFVTSLFLHSPNHIFHILFNLLALWLFGREVEARFGPRKFLLFYFTAGVFAGFCYVLFAALAGNSFVPVVGASGAIMGILVIFGFLLPDAVVLAFLMIPMKARNLVLLLIGIDLVYFFFMTDSSRAVTAHLGGALFGFLFFRYEPRVRERLRRMEANDRRRAQTQEHLARKRVDELLEKMGRGERLTTKERRFLGQASKRYYTREKD